MTRVEAVPPPMERQAHGRFNRLPRSIETDKKSWVVFTVNADLVNVASTSLGGQSPIMRQLAAPNMVYVRDTYARTIPTSGFVEMTPDPQAGIFLNTWLDQISQDVGEQLSAAFQPTQGISEHTKREDEVANMISSSQSMLTVASSVFKAMRPLTDKERRYLGKFYNRAFKTR